MYHLGIVLGTIPLTREDKIEIALQENSLSIKALFDNCFAIKDKVVINKVIDMLIEMREALNGNN